MRSTPERWLLTAIAIASVFLLFHPPASCADETSTWQQAHSKFDAGDYAGAKTLFTDLLQQFPTTAKAADAELHLARSRWKTNDGSTQDLIQAFSQVRTEYPSSPEAGEALLHIGFLHAKLRVKADSDQSVADFTSFLESYPSHPRAGEVQYTIAMLHCRNGDLDKAEAALRKAKMMTRTADWSPDDAALQIGFVKLLRFYSTKQKGHLNDAIEALAAVKSSGQEKIRAMADLGIAEATLLLGQPVDAREKYLSAAQTYADKPYYKGMALSGAACCSQFEGKLARAVADYDAVLQALSGSTLAEKDAAWKSAALSNTGPYVQSSVQSAGAWNRLSGSDIVAKSAYSRAECLHLLGKYNDAEEQLGTLLTAFSSGEVADKAQILLGRSTAAKGGR